MIHACLLLALALPTAFAASALTVTVRYPDSGLPALANLYLRGDGCGLNWSTGVRLTHSATNTWTTTLTCSTNGALEMKALVNDKTWMIGANHHVASGASGAEIYPWFYSYAGQTQVIKKVYSPELKNYRDVIVYTPPSYYENTLKQYQNVLIMHDGQNLFDPRTAFMGNAWLVQDTVNPMITSGSMDEVLIVGVYNTENRTYEYTYSFDPSEGFGGDGDIYLNFLESTIIPLTKSTFRVSVSRERLGILGSSLGGLISCYAGWTRGNVYGKVGCMSSSFWWNDQDFQHDVLPSHLPATQPTFYVDAGTSIGGEAQCAVYSSQVVEYMESVGYTRNEKVFLYIDNGGSHNEKSWGARFDEPMAALYPPITV